MHPTAKTASGSIAAKATSCICGYLMWPHCALLTQYINCGFLILSAAPLKRIPQSLQSPPMDCWVTRARSARRCCRRHKPRFLLTSLQGHLEALIWIWIVGLVEDYARLNMQVLSHVHQVVVLTAAVPDQPKILLLPDTAAFALGEADTLVPVFVWPLSQISHPQLAIDREHGSIKCGPQAIVSSFLTQRHHWFVTVTRLLTLV